ncbi:MAG: hypothetical protein RMJ44_06495 [Cytophagales bacterium]|nr:hypothetical protein [Bernardetiaceae bacterium]MDW8210720.1 hypothetical protein [Cytophagales bacterium]
MKRLYLLSAIICAIAWACGKSEEEQRAELKAKIKAKLSDNKLTQRFVDGLISELIVKYRKAGFDVIDTSSQFPIIAFPLQYDSVNYPIADDMTVLGVLMRDQLKGDTLKVDFKLQWDPNIKVNDTTMGNFKLIAAEVRMMKGKERYQWVKQGEYYIKQAKLLQ